MSPLSIARVAACAALLLGSLPAFGNVAARLPESALIGGMAIGASSRSYEPRTLFETVDELRRAGAEILEIHAGQPLSASLPEVRIGDTLTDDQLSALKRKLSSTSAKLVAARVRFSNNNSANTRLFEWADQLGVQVLVGDPPAEQFDALEKLIRRFTIGVGIVTAPRPATVPRSPGPSPTDPAALAAALRGRDPRFGVVLNVLHLARAGVDPYKAASDLRTRLLGIQLTDLSSLGTNAQAVPFGTGALDFVRLLNLLDTQRFGGYLAFDPPADPAFKDDLRLGLAFFREKSAQIQRENRLRLATRSVRPLAGFTYEVLSQGEIAEPTHVETCPDGSVWIAARRGHLWAWSPVTRTNQLVARFDVDTTGQRGLLAFVFDPDFATHRHLYLLRTPMLATGRSNRLSRFTATLENGAWSVPAASETVLLEFPSALHGRSQGGGLLYHPGDQCLYLGTGDNILPGETARVYDDPRNAPQDPRSLLGKILRLRTDGSVPNDNPFAASPSTRGEIFALGLRNPFTLALDPRSQRVFAGDVGYDRPEDLEEINLIRPGANFGWPRCDGRHLDTLSGTPCPVPDAVAPWYTYPHGSAAAAILGPFTPAPRPSAWPAALQHGFFLADFPKRSVRFAQIDPARDVVTNTVVVASGLSGGPTSLSLGADGTLYMTEYAGWFAASPQDRVSRLVPSPRPAPEPATRAPSK